MFMATPTSGSGLHRTKDDTPPSPCPARDVIIVSEGGGGRAAASYIRMRSSQEGALGPIAMSPTRQWRTCPLGTTTKARPRVSDDWF